VRFATRRLGGASAVAPELDRRQKEVGGEYRKRVDGQGQINAKFVMLPRRARAGCAGGLGNSGVKAKRPRGAYMSFLHKILGDTRAPATGKPIARGKLSAQMALRRAKPDEKLSLLRYLPPAVKWAPRSSVRTSRCSRIVALCTVSRSPLPSAAPSLRFTPNREVLCVG